MDYINYQRLFLENLQNLFKLKNKQVQLKWNPGI